MRSILRQQEHGSAMKLPALAKILLRTLACAVARPYISRELPGWGTIYEIFVGGYARNWLWEGVHKHYTNKRFGYRIGVDLERWADRSAYFLRRWYDLPVQLLVAKLLTAGDTVIDVGANRGNFALAAAFAVGARGRVIAFEPQPDQIAILERDLLNNDVQHVTIHQMGLGNENTALTLSVPIVNSGEASFASVKYSDVRRIEVPVRIGDEVLRECTPSLIKIDVEGFETRVIEGLRQTICRSRPFVITEVFEEHLTRCGSSSEELFRMMEELGYGGYALGLRRARGGHEVTLQAIRGAKHFTDVLWLPKELPVSESIGSLHM